MRTPPPILFGNDINTADDLAEQIQDMSVEELGVLKAVMEVIGPVTLDDAMELASQSGEYIFESDIRGVEQAAEAELNTMAGEKDTDLLKKHLNMYAYPGSCPAPLHCDQHQRRVLPSQGTKGIYAPEAANREHSF